jgi:hypothetical protein
MRLLELKAAISGLDLARLESMKNVGVQKQGGRMAIRASALKYVGRLTMLLSVMGAAVSCDSTSTNGTYTNAGGFVPTATSGVQISANLLPSVITTTGFCSTGVLTTPVELVVVPSRETVSVDSVTLHMIDGSNLGGPAITFPSSELVRMFGTTAVVRPRRFIFSPGFVCSDSRPRSVEVDVILVDSGGNMKRLSASAAWH